MRKPVSVLVFICCFHLANNEECLGKAKISSLNTGFHRIHLFIFGILLDWHHGTNLTFLYALSHTLASIDICILVSSHLVLSHRSYSLFSVSLLMIHIMKSLVLYSFSSNTNKHRIP